MAKHEQTVLVLQGGGALGAYQAGVYEGIAETGLAPNWIAGVSIGAINAALIGYARSGESADVSVIEIYKPPSGDPHTSKNGSRSYDSPGRDQLRSVPVHRRDRNSSRPHHAHRPGIARR